MKPLNVENTITSEDGASMVLVLAGEFQMGASSEERCSNCHEPHSLSLRAEGNALCTQCHRETAVDRFPMLQPGSYDTPAHHFHEAGSAGSECVNCHMTSRTYMGVDARRDHGFHLPRPDLSEELDLSDACSGCHERRGVESPESSGVSAWAAA